MKKRNILAIVLSACIGLTAFAATGCGVGGKKKIDVGDRLELKVYNFNGGVGRKWMDAVQARFEEANKDRVFEISGRKGVVINTNNDGNNIGLENISGRDESVYFLEGVHYLDLTDKIVDISDIVRGENPYETGKTIESKLSADTKSALSAHENKYYVLPHYQAYSGIMYNKTLFDKQMLYFAKNVDDYRSQDPNDVEYGFIKNKTCEKTVGPDGVAGTEDDGLPSSIDEFIALCEYMKDKTITPFIYYSAGGVAHAYQQKLSDALWVNIEGYEGAMAQFKFDSNGQPSSIVTSFDSNDNPATKQTVITDQNAYEMYQQESRYHALRAAQYVFSDAENYHARSTASSDNHEIQELFLQGEAAMMLEGTYWLNEATDYGVFNLHPEYKEQDIRFMPLPVQGTGSVTEGNGKSATVINIHTSFAFINGNTEKKYGPEVLQVAKEFLQFCYTDESLQEFTVKSSSTKDLNYTLSSENYNKLDSFAKSIWDIKGADATGNHVVNTLSGHPIFVKNSTKFDMYNPMIWETEIGFRYPTQAFTPTSTTTARSYFEGMKKSQSWWNSLNR